MQYTTQYVVYYAMFWRDYMKVYGNSTSINDLISSAMDKLKTIVDSSTIIGDSIMTPEGVTIIPISKVTVGFVVGGGEYADLSSRRVSNHFPMTGGSSGGMSVSPVGFLILQSDGEVDFVNVENKSLYQTVLNMFNSILEKIQKKSNCSCDDTQDEKSENGDEQNESEVDEEDLKGHAKKFAEKKQKKSFFEDEEDEQ